MNFPVLIAHTPRAGRWNHLVLLPPLLPPTVNVAAYLSAVLTTTRGENYLAVSVDVMQPTTGRIGREMLLLVGLSLPEGEKLAALEMWMRQRLLELGDVIAKFDWDAHTGGYAQLVELQRWRDEVVAAFELQPHSVELFTPLPIATSEVPQSRWFWIVWTLAMIGFALFVAGLLHRFAISS